MTDQSMTSPAVVGSKPTPADSVSSLSYEGEGPFLFINYRTLDTGEAADRLARALAGKFGSARVFVDAKSLDGGDVWTERLRDNLQRATVFFALIGKTWLHGRDPTTQERRLDQKDDWVRTEIDFALQQADRGVLLVPILVDDAPRPSELELPASIRAMAQLQTRLFRTNEFFDADLAELVGLLSRRGFTRHGSSLTIEPDSVYRRVEIQHYVERRWLSDCLDAFLLSHRAGYFVIEAQSGMGKTAFLAHLVQTRGYIQHFVELQSHPEAALRNLASQIQGQFGMDSAKASDASRADFLETLLTDAAARRRPYDGPVVIVIDGLDGIHASEHRNVLCLPRKVPEGFFFVVTQRPVEVRLDTESDKMVVTIDPQSENNRRELAAYVAKFLPNHDAAVPQIVSRSDGSWVYAHYVCREIREGRRDPRDTEGLPRGLWQYYAQNWSKWRDSHPADWGNHDLPILCTLSATKESLPLDLLAKLAGTKPDGLNSLLMVHWRPFVSVMQGDDGARFRLHHASLGDFVHGMSPREQLSSAERAFADELRTATTARHAAIARLTLDGWGGTALTRLRELAPDEYRWQYGWRHIVEHLAQADEREVLGDLLGAEWNFPLEPPGGPPSLFAGWLQRAFRRRAPSVEVPRSAWFETHARAGDLALFLDDWARAERATNAWNSSTSAHVDIEPRGIVLRIEAMLVRASVRDAALRIPDGLLASLVREGRWSPEQTIAYAQRMTDEGTQAELLTEIVEVEGSARAAVLDEALEAAESLEPERRIGVFARLLARCSCEAREDIASRVARILPETPSGAFVKEAPRLVPYLTISHCTDLVEWAYSLKPIYRLRVLKASTAAAPNDVTLRGAREAAVRACLEDTDARSSDPRMALELAPNPSLVDDPNSLIDSVLRWPRSQLRGRSQEEEVRNAYEAITELALALPEIVGPRLASVVEDALALTPSDPVDDHTFMLAATRAVITFEQVGTRVAAELIAVAPPSAMDEVEKLVLRTKPRLNNWEAHAALAVRRAELGASARALRIVARIENRWNRDQALAAVAPFLELKELRAILARKDAELKRLRRGSQSGSSVPIGSSGSLEATGQPVTVVAVAPARSDFSAESAILVALTGLIPRLAELGEVPEALRRLGQLRSAREREPELWQNVAAGVGRHVRGEALDQILRWAMEFDDRDRALVTLAQLAPFLDEERVRLLAEACKLIGSSQSPFRLGLITLPLRRAALHPLAVRLAELGKAQDALLVIAQFLDHTHASGAIAEMADCLGDVARVIDSSFLPIALAVAAGHRRHFQPQALEALAPALTPELRRQAFDLARANRDPELRAWALAALLSAEDGPQSSAVAREALDSMAAGHDFQHERPRILGLLAPYLEEALKLCRQLVRAREKGSIACLGSLLRAANPDVFKDMLSLAREVLEPDGLLQLSEFLPADVFNEIVARVSESTSDAAFASASRRLAALGAPLDAFRMTLRIRDVDVGTRAARQLAPVLARTDRSQLLAFWNSECWAMTEPSREEAFGLAGKLVPLVHALAGQQAVDALFQSIQRGYRWWAAFYPS